MAVDLIKNRLSPPFHWTCGPDFLVFGLVCTIISNELDPQEWPAIGLCAIIGILIVIYRIYQIILKEREQIINNIFFTFLLFFLLFFLVGPLLLVFGNPDEIDYALDFFSITANDAMTVLGANLIGFGFSMTIGRYLHFRSFIYSTARRFSRLQTANLWRMAILLAVLGLIFKAYVLYNDLFTRETISGLYRTAQLLAPVGIFLYFKEKGFNLTLKLLFFLCVVVLYLVGGLVEFNKTEFFMPLLALAGGLLVRNMTFTNLVISVVGLAILGVVLQPINTNARNEGFRRVNPSLEERFDIFTSAYRGELQNTGLNNIGLWSRLDYTSPQAAAMWLYDVGRGGDSYQLIPWVLLPRMIFPNKPIMTTAGTTFTYKIKGFNTSSTGQGIFISGYYDLGWFGLFGASALAGFALAWYRAVMIAARISNSTILLLFGLQGHLMAFNISGDYLSSYLGLFIISIYIFVILNVVLWVKYYKHPKSTSKTYPL